MVNGLSFNTALNHPQAEESTKQVFLPFSVSSPITELLKGKNQLHTGKKGFKRKALILSLPTCSPVLQTLNEKRVPGILKQSEPARILLKVPMAQVARCEWIISGVSWVHISFEYKKQNRNGACSSLFPYSVKTRCSQLFFYLFRIMYYFNSQHLVSKSPSETIYKSQQFPDCKCHGTLVLCNRKTFQLIKITDGKGKLHARAEPLVPPKAEDETKLYLHNPTNILCNKLQQSCALWKWTVHSDLEQFSCE